jgi:hypothetical protein
VFIALILLQTIWRGDSTLAALFWDRYSWRMDWVRILFYSDFGPVWQKNTGPNLFVGLFELFWPIVKVTVQYREQFYMACFGAERECTIQSNCTFLPDPFLKRRRRLADFGLQVFFFFEIVIVNINIFLLRLSGRCQISHVPHSARLSWPSLICFIFAVRYKTRTIPERPAQTTQQQQQQITVSAECFFFFLFNYCARCKCWPPFCLCFFGWGENDMRVLFFVGRAGTRHTCP